MVLDDQELLINCSWTILQEQTFMGKIIDYLDSCFTIKGKGPLNAECALKYSAIENKHFGLNLIRSG